MAQKDTPPGILRREGEVLTGMREVSMSEFVKAHAAGAAVIDVGEVEEYNRGHIPGAVSLPVGDMSRDLTAACCQIRRDAPVYVVCAAGNRSLIATGMLMHAGYDAYSVSAGPPGGSGPGTPLSVVTVSVTDAATAHGLEMTDRTTTENGATTPAATGGRDPRRSRRRRWGTAATWSTTGGSRS